MSRWLLRKRLLLVFALVIVAVVIGALVFGDIGQISAPAQVVSTWSSYLLLATFVTLVVVTGVVLVSVGALTHRIAEIAARVEQQLASGDLDIVVEADRAPKGEIGRLITALNDLGQAYRLSLQNLARQTDERAVLDLLAATINRTLDLQEVLDTSLRGTLKTVKWDMGAIYMWDDRNDSLNMVSFIGFSEDVVRQKITHRLGEGLIGKSAESRKLLIAAAGEQPSSAMEPDGEGIPVIQISIPLVTVPGQLLGVMEIGSAQPKTLAQSELNLLRTVASHVSLAIDKAQLYTKVSQHAVELEKLVAARTVQLSQAIDELWVALKQAQEADRIKSLLLSTVSHELRTPLATIKGNTSLLIQHHKKIPTETFIEHLKDIDEETDKLTELISNLLEMSRIEAGMLHIQSHSIDLIKILEDAVEAARMRLRDHAIRLEQPVPSLSAYGDARRIEQVLANLLDNAAKYSPAKSLIEVQVEEDDRQVIVAVKDRGRGIAPEHLGRIFDRFYQISASPDSGRHGIGLGLAICRGLVEAQGGRIWVESQVGQGSTFYFSLPTVRDDTLQEEE
ncbi:MAG: GAF domain-containing protein [Anaerolineae bacterium]|nr:GAF domain-containing protein [Anaerolineae bacterium]